MKSKQFCSVCKEWLDMEVVPTSDGEDDDGVIWFRCPQCEGFLPKLGGAEGPERSEASQEQKKPVAEKQDQPGPADDDPMDWDSPADMMAAQEKDRSETPEPEILGTDEILPLDLLPDLETSIIPDGIDEIDEIDEVDAVDAVESADSGDTDEPAAKKPSKPEEPPEPVLEYAALLASKDFGEARPYRPWETYEVGSCIHHLAWGDCGVVVAKESLPGGREIIKCFFEEAGVVRLIEKAPR